MAATSIAALAYGLLVAWPRIKSERTDSENSTVEGLVFFDTESAPDPQPQILEIPPIAPPIKKTPPKERPAIWMWVASPAALAELPQFPIPFVESLPQLGILVQALLPANYNESCIILGNTIDESLVLAAKIPAADNWVEVDATWSAIGINGEIPVKRWDASVIDTLDKPRLGGHAECWLRGDLLAKAPGELSLQSVGLSIHSGQSTNVRVVIVPGMDTPLQKWVMEAYDRPRSSGRAEPETLELDQGAAWVAALSLPSSAALMDLARWTRNTFKSSPLPNQAAPALEVMAVHWDGHIRAISYPDGKWLVQLFGKFNPDMYAQIIGVSSFWGMAAQQEILWRQGLEMKTTIGWNNDGVVINDHPTASVALTVLSDETPLYQKRVHFQNSSGSLQLASGLDALFELNGTFTKGYTGTNDIAPGAALFSLRTVDSILVVRPALAGQTPYLDAVWSSTKPPL